MQWTVRWRNGNETGLHRCELRDDFVLGLAFAVESWLNSIEVKLLATWDIVGDQCS